MNWPHLVVAGIAAILTFFVCGRALTDHSTLRPPWVIAFCVAILVFLSLYKLSEQWMNVILLPYAALGLAVLVMFVLLAFKKGKDKKKDEHRYEKE